MCFNTKLSDEDKRKINEEFSKNKKPNGKPKPSFETPIPPPRRSSLTSSGSSSSSSSGSKNSYVTKRVVKDLFKKRQLSLRTIGINNPKEWDWDKFGKKK